MQETVTQRFIEAFNVLKLNSKVNSQKEFAELLGFPEQYFSGFRTGSRKVSPTIINKLCTLYSISLSYIISGVGSLYNEEGKTEFSKVVGKSVEKSESTDKDILVKNTECEQRLEAALVRIQNLEDRLRDKEQIIALLMKSQ